MIVSGNTTFERELPPVGATLGRLIRIIDLGTHEEEFKGEKKFTRKVKFIFELSDDLMKDGRPFIISSEGFTFNISEKAKLRKFIETAIGRKLTEQEVAGYDISQMINQVYSISIATGVSKKGSEYAYIASISPKRKSDALRDPENQVFIFDLDNFDDAIFQKLGKYDQELIQSSVEFLNIGTEE